MQIYLKNEVKYATQHIISIKSDTPLDFGMAQGTHFIAYSHFSY